FEGHSIVAASHAVLRAPVAPFAWRKNARDIEPFAAIIKKRSHGVPHIVVHRLQIIVVRSEPELLPVSVYHLEVRQTRDDLRFEICRPIARGADKTGGRRADAFDGFGTEGNLFYIHTWR